jgi:asparagine synthase (glutamine-hydrolysing)
VKKIAGIVGFKDLHLSEQMQIHKPFTVSDDQNLLFLKDVEKHHQIMVQMRGTIFNHIELCRRFHLDDKVSSSRFLIAGYSKVGEKFFTLLEGSFSFVLYDGREKKLYLYKDHVSSQPLYYYDDGKYLLFADRLESFFQFGFIQKCIDHRALENYFTYGYILQPNVIYRYCNKVEAGTYICVDVDKRECQKHIYWDLGKCYDEPKYDDDESVLQEKAHNYLRHAVQKMLPADQKSYHILLSGGYDSATLAALLSKEKYPLNTYTIGFEERSINEADDAAKIAHHLGAVHHEHYFSAADALNVIPRLSDIYEEPFYDEGSIPTLFLSQLVESEGARTVFCGDGGDEVFATADDDKKFRRILSIPKEMREMAYHVGKGLKPHRIPILRDYYNFPTKYYKFLQIFSANDIPQMVKTKMILFDPYEISQLIGAENVLMPITSHNLYFGEYAEDIDKITGSYFKTFMVNGELVKSTQAFFSADIDVKIPYLDKDLISFMARVPASVKVKEGIKKNVLKNIAYEYIPKSLLDRPKKGFSIPSSRWLYKELNTLLLDTLNPENLRQDDILNVSFVIKLRDNFLNGKEEYKYKLWSILLYQLWYQKNMRKG